MYIQHPSITKLIGTELELALPENANIIDAIIEVDKIILSQGKFPSQYYYSLLHWVYHPLEERFYKQASIIAYLGPGNFLNVRGNPTMSLPEGVIIHINPEGPCITEADDILDCEAFKKTLQRNSS